MITVICPTLNEEAYIDQLIDFFCNSYPQDKELLIIDGGSTDNTLQIVNKWQNENPNIKLLHNSNKYVPYALNMGIRCSTGDPIIRLDAHTRYAPDYFIMIIKTFSETDADIVGGPMNAVGNSNLQNAIAFATSTPFGIGNSKIHNTKFKGYTDHVYLGAWRRELFSHIGYFDEKLKRNQDDEFHYRAKSLGKRIYLDPQIKSYYFPRSTFLSLFTQYFQYGLFKPLVLHKIKSEIKTRHLVPGIFVFYLLSVPLWKYLPILAFPIIFYMVLNLFFSFNNRNSYIIKLYSILVFPVIHFAYGVGTIIGIKKMFKE